jgi:hypothetical protein
MKTFSLAAVVLLLAGCGVSTAELDDLDPGTSEVDGELSSTRDTYLLARKDQRRCVSPMCGGYWVRDLNSTMQERYVSGFDFSESSLTADQQSMVTSASDEEVVLLARLGARETRFGTRPLLVKRAFRGMPGKRFGAGDTFYGLLPVRVVCQSSAPCAYLSTTRLNRTTGHAMTTDVDASAALAAHVDDQWLLSRVFSGKTVLAGRIVRQGGHVTLAASQVFVELPDRVSPCIDQPPPRCASGYVNSFERSPDRCTEPTGCTPPGVCAQASFACEPGYRQVTWFNVCPRMACEPEYLEP